MKRLAAVCVGLVVLLALPACMASAPASERESGAQIPNPMEEYATPDFSAAAGFQVLAYPAYTLESVWLIDDRIGELKFTIDETTQPNFRVAVDTGQDISGDYAVYEDIATENIGDIEVTIYRNEMGPTRAEWVKDGYAFSLFVDNLGNNDFTEVIRNFVTEVTMDPVPAPPAPG